MNIDFGIMTMMMNEDSLIVTLGTQLTISYCTRFLMKQQKS